MTIETQMPDGSWRPAAPMPLLYGWLFWAKGRYGCSCGRRFYRLATYETHWLTHPTQETDEPDCTRCGNERTVGGYGTDERFPCPVCRPTQETDHVE